MATKPFRNFHWKVHKPIKGLKVVRHPGWEFKDQDEGAEYGVIIEHNKGISMDWSVVVWIAPDGKITNVGGYKNETDLLHYDIRKVYDWARTQEMINGGGKTFNDIYEMDVLVDLYYQAHPEELEIPQNVLDQWQLK